MKGGAGSPGEPAMSDQRDAAKDDVNRSAIASNAGRFRRTLESRTGFAVAVELVTWPGVLADTRGDRARRVALELASDARVTALSITDGAGGRARLSPESLAEAVMKSGHDVIVHVACRDRSRNGLVSMGWELLSRELTTVLAVTGDFPVEGVGGLSRPVFDMDSVGLLATYAGMGSRDTQRSDGRGVPTRANGFYLGAVVNNHKRYERELIPQYLKLALKVRTGAQFVISQLGYDARKSDELLRAMRLHGLAIPVLANGYILDRGSARAFRSGRVPGCVVSDELLAVVERQARSPDKGRGFFLELAAKQIAVARGLGFRGMYLAGHRDGAELRRVLDLADAFAPGDWRLLVRDLSFGIPGGFQLFERDEATGLNTDELERRYRTSLREEARRQARRHVSPLYRANRAIHAAAFAAGTPGFRLGARSYTIVERFGLGRPLHVLERATKVPLFQCRDCGDCALPDLAYLCAESQCPKNQRNGPCGGSRNGRCEVLLDQPCVWARAYTRLKPYGEELGMLDRPPILQDNALRRTSAWANTFLGRDHAAKRTATAPLGRPMATAQGNRP